ncbi:MULTISPECIES: hypothetical protein [Rhizobium]|uniref:Uncharacterized protein n=1 Tax=Rhizobium favelukesii TaxID=348824 RepID=W6S9Q6_9HYPH|nr:MULTISPECIES: hypothetical protein [Rhizobium]MCA0805363.1 hypothetical protein [Rhizobium sp. T1473]MCS0462237.1 hypothetical protein [Rhizobium favelukesii]UFS79309.1 hypothetical protein LPB79_06860 [Rhizobium sp. T136]CDM62846.1 hypothetical protein LPU83_pLPU83d_1476 [Rhizobium favelukesii]
MTTQKDYACPVEVFNHWLILVDDSANACQREGCFGRNISVNQTDNIKKWRR